MGEFLRDEDLEKNVTQAFLRYRKFTGAMVSIFQNFLSVIISHMKALKFLVPTAAWGFNDELITCFHCQ